MSYHPTSLYALKWTPQTSVTIPDEKLRIGSTTQAVSIDLWANISKLTSSYFVFKSDYMAFGVKNGRLQFALNTTDCGWRLYKTKAEIDLCRWNHVAFTFSVASGLARTYVNGQMEDTTKINGHLNYVENKKDPHTRLGFPLATFTDSMMTNMRIWDVCLEPEAIHLLYKADIYGDRGFGTTTGLLAWWKMNSGYDKTLIDASQNHVEGVCNIF